MGNAKDTAMVGLCVSRKRGACKVPVRKNAPYSCNTTFGSRNLAEQGRNYWGK